MKTLVSPEIPQTARFVRLIATYPLLSAALLMTLFAMLIRLSLHNFAFWGDCWFVLHRPYFEDPWDAIKSHALRFGRPGEVLYYIPMFRLAGFNAYPWLLVSFFWLAAASLLCGVCLRRSYPDLKLLHVGVPLFVFFSTALGPLVYRMDLDQGRLCMLFFWLSAACYQSFVLRRSDGFVRSGYWLVAAAFASVYSLLCYEASLLLFLGASALLLPLWLQLDRRIRRTSLVEILTTMLAVLAIYMSMRYFLFEGGKDQPLRTIPRIMGFFEAAWNAIEFLFAPILNIHWDSTTVVVFVVSFIVVGVLLRCAADPSGGDERNDRIRKQVMYAIACGIVFFVAGVTPFLLGKYTYDRISFAGHSRIFAAAWYGLSISTIAALYLFRARWARRGSVAVLTAFVAGGSTQIYDLHRDWEIVTDINARMWRDFFEQVPDISDKSYFIFKDLYGGIPSESLYGLRAYLSASANGIEDFIQIAYNNRMLRAEYLHHGIRALYPWYRLTITGAEAQVRVPGEREDWAFPVRRYVLVERQGYSLKVVDAWTPATAGPGVNWEDGATSIQTSFNRIKPLPDGDTRTPEDRVRALGYKIPPDDYVIPFVELR